MLAHGGRSDGHTPGYLGKAQELDDTDKDPKRADILQPSADLDGREFFPT